MPRPPRGKAARNLADTELVFNALAHPSRRQILLVLHYRGGELLAGDIASRFSCSWPTTTRHLGVLVKAGLIQVDKDGRRRIYRLMRARLGEVAGGWLSNFEEAS